MLTVEKAESVPEKDLWFWSHRTDGQAFTFSNAVTTKTPNWCDFHEWATDVPCYVCRERDPLRALFVRCYP